jgi:hypothetical protein
MQWRWIGLLLSVSLLGVGRLPAAEVPRSDALIAIDVVLCPDATMAVAAKSLNVRLRRAADTGFAFDATHHPHVSLLQLYIRAKDLPHVEEAAALVTRHAKPSALSARVKGLSVMSWSGLSMLSIDLRANRDLMKLQRRIAEAVGPFAVTPGVPEAFVTDPDALEIDAQTVAYVENFIPAHSGAKYKPHLSVGVAPDDDVRELRKERIKPFEFGLKSLAIYRMGNFCTARQKLWESTDKR